MSILAGGGERGYFVCKNVQNWLKKPPILTAEMESTAFFPNYRILQRKKVNTL